MKTIFASEIELNKFKVVEIDEVNNTYTILNKDINSIDKYEDGVVDYISNKIYDVLLEGLKIKGFIEI